MNHRISDEKSTTDGGHGQSTEINLFWLLPPHEVASYLGEAVEGYFCNVCLRPILALARMFGSLPVGRTLPFVPLIPFAIPRVSPNPSYPVHACLDARYRGGTFAALTQLHGELPRLSGNAKVYRQ